MSEIDAKVGAVLRHERTLRRMSQLTLAAKLHHHQGWVCRAEKGEFPLGVDTLRVWAGLFDLTPSEVLRRALEEPPPSAAPPPRARVACRNCGEEHAERKDGKRLCATCMDHLRRKGYARGQVRELRRKVGS